MSNAKTVMSQAANTWAGPTYIEDVFSTYLYTGNGSTQTITNGIDLAGEGGAVFIKTRSGPTPNQLMNIVDTERGDQVRFVMGTGAAIPDSDFGTFLSTGFSLDGSNQMNASGNEHASWTFRKAPRFFDVVTWTGDGTWQRAIPHNLGTAPGFFVVKVTSTTSNWSAYHRSLGATKQIRLNTTDAATTDGWINNVAPTDTHFTVYDHNLSGVTYVAYLFAHDPLGPSGDGSDGLIACGSFTTDSNSRATVNLGWEPQHLIFKAASTTGSWEIDDVMRGWGETQRKYLLANLSNAESSADNITYPIKPTSTGFSFDLSAAGGFANTTYIYIAIRRGPMRQPESGTEVFAANQVDAATSSSITVDLGNPVDMAFVKCLPSVASYRVENRLTGLNTLKFDATDAEFALTDTSLNYFDSNTTASVQATNSTGIHQCWGFRRAPGFFDVVAYTGDNVGGRVVEHNLGAVPELIIVKKRNGTGSWYVYNKTIGATKTLTLDTTSAPLTHLDYWYNTEPTSSSFYVGAGNPNNYSSYNYIAYLFATLAGVSKVGSYTGNGTNQTIDCGFTSGARFVLIKRTDSTGDWYVWDTARGIVAANDPHLSLNTSAAEVTTDDSIDPDSSGFVVNQNTATNINVSSASYIFLAIA